MKMNMVMAGHAMGRHPVKRRIKCWMKMNMVMTLIEMAPHHGESMVILGCGLRMSGGELLEIRIPIGAVPLLQ